MGDNSRQHGFEVECGADRLTNFAQCFQLTDRLHQLPRPCFQFLEQPHVLDSDYRLSRKSLKQLDLPLGERTNLCSSDIDYTNRISFPEHGYTKKCPCSRSAYHNFAVGIFGFGGFREIENMYAMPVKNRSASRGPPAQMPKLWSRSGSERRHQSVAVALNEANHCISRFAQPCRIFCHDIKNGLNVCRRAGNHAQDFTCGSLLLQRLLELGKQSHVFNSDHRLVGEGFEEGDLLIGERSHLGTANHNSSNRNILSEQRRSNYRMSACNLLNVRGVRELRFKLCRQVMYVHCFPVEHSSSSGCSTRDRSLHRHHRH